MSGSCKKGLSEKDDTAHATHHNSKKIVDFKLAQ
jgi:hypothetical protein